MNTGAMVHNHRIARATGGPPACAIGEVGAAVVTGTLGKAFTVEWLQRLGTGRQ